LDCILSLEEIYVATHSYIIGISGSSSENQDLNLGLESIPLQVVVIQAHVL
jgi:hypothetical protein